MNTKVLIAAVAGTVVSFLLGWLVFGMLLADFYKENMGSATGVMKEPPLMWAIALSSFFWSLTYALIFHKWAGIKTLAAGATAGAWLTLLIAASFDFNLFGTTNIIGNLKAVAVDLVVNTVIGAIIGAVIGLVLGMGKKE
jgi:hypothetical protein